MFYYFFDFSQSSTFTTTVFVHTGAELRMKPNVQDTHSKSQSQLWTIVVVTNDERQAEMNSLCIDNDDLK